MANLAPSFASGSNLIIRIGTHVLAYASNLSFSDDVSMASVGGLGSTSYDALEPLQYSARGSLVITRYTSKAYDAITAKNAPTRSSNATISTKGLDNGAEITKSDGNSLLLSGSFNPVAILTSVTFDIDVFNRKTENRTTTGIDDKSPIFVLKDCRFTNYSMDFVPGSLVTERLSFMCLRIEDRVAQKITIET